jgi:hypothetical protein
MDGAVGAVSPVQGRSLIVAGQTPWRRMRGGATYVSDMCGGLRVNGIVEGLCQAMMPKMKTITAPALTASANSGFRPPAAVSNIISLQIRNCVQEPEQRREGRPARCVQACREAAPQPKSGAQQFYKAWFRQGRQPSAQHPSSHLAVARLRLALSALCGAWTPSTSLAVLSSDGESDDRGSWSRAHVGHHGRVPPNGCHGIGWRPSVDMALLRRMPVCTQSRGAHGGFAFLCFGFPGPARWCCSKHVRMIGNRCGQWEIVDCIRESPISPQTIMPANTNTSNLLTSSAPFCNLATCNTATGKVLSD